MPSRSLHCMWRLAGFLILWTFLCHGPAAAKGEEVDLAIVLAVDCSGSVDGGEYALQIGGIVSAFRDAEVQAAIAGGRHGRIAVTLMTWGDPDYEKYTTDWFIVSTPATAESFAAAVAAFRGRMGGGTGIANAIGYGLTLIEHSGFAATREVIDVSGDGPESWEIREPRFTLQLAQAMRERAGVVVNGLAIETDHPDLDIYYRLNVAAGPGSFVMSVAAYEDVAEAMKRKLLREILPATASLPE